MIELEGFVIDETIEAWHINFEGDKEWVPKSLIGIIDKNNSTVEIKKWKAKELFPDYIK